MCQIKQVNAVESFVVSAVELREELGMGCKRTIFILQI